MTTHRTHRVVLFCLLVAGAAGRAVSRTNKTPVETVLSLLDDLEEKVISEGSVEAQAYDEFACFCKDTTGSKSTAILTGRDDINSYSADIASKTATKKEKEADLAERSARQQALDTELGETKVSLAKARAEYEATAADLSKAITSLESAIHSMVDAGGKRPVLLQEVHQTLVKSLATADAMGLLSEPQRKGVSAFLQTGASVDPNDPMYKYHSDGIVATLDKLLDEFKAEKETLDEEWTKTEKTLTDRISAIEDEMRTNKQAMDQLELDIERLSGEIASDKEGLIDAEAQLKDDQLYMKDLTARCEIRAKDWDQRSAMRSGEIAAIRSAIKILSRDVSHRDDFANKRALVQSGAQPLTPRMEAKKVSITPHTESVSFVQVAENVQDARAQLRGRTGLSAQATQAKVLALLRKEGDRLGSKVLNSLATKVEADPFTKIKTIIQKLIERLLKESEAEATKKGWCDTELGKATQDRDYRAEDLFRLSAEVEALNLKITELLQEEKILDAGIREGKRNLELATSQRKEEHEDNMLAIKTAKEGFEAVTKALTILKVFYKNAAKAKDPVFVQASPVDEDTGGAGFKGAYKGSQEDSKGILGMLEVIKSDFDRTVRHTEAAEKKSLEEFVLFDRTSRADIAGKETKYWLTQEQRQTTTGTMETTKSDLRTASNLVDAALRTLEDLKPTCIDTGMSYTDRTAKRAEEMAALKTALCILDTNGVETLCQ